MKIEQELYKVTLYDLTCHPIVDGTICFFTEDIEDFQKRWIKCGASEGRVERFLRSKAGELVTDYYFSDDSDLNIVQHDTCIIYDEKEFTLGNIYFKIRNAIDYPSWLHADKVELKFKWIRFKETFYRVAKVKAEGLTEYYLLKDGKYDFQIAECVGNPVMERLPSDKTFERFIYSENVKDFAENGFVSICYLLDRYFANENALLRDTRKFLVTKRELEVLFENFTNC